MRKLLNKLFNLILSIIILIVILILLTLYSFKNSKIIVYRKTKQVTEIKKQVTISNFDSIIQVTFDFEGGFQNHSADVANYNSLGQCIGTNFGISAIALESYKGYPVQTSDILNLSMDTAKRIYQIKFWNEIRGEEIKDKKLSHLIFDSYIANPSTSRKMLSMTLSHFGFKTNIAYGKFQDEVISQINQCNPIDFYNIFWEYRRQNFESLRNKYPQFIEGWMNRLNYFKK